MYIKFETDYGNVKCNITSIEEGVKFYCDYRDIEMLGASEMGNGEIFESGKKIDTIVYNGRLTSEIN